MKQRVPCATLILLALAPWNPPTIAPVRRALRQNPVVAGSEEGALNNDTEVPTSQAGEVLLRAAEEARTKAGDAAPDSEAFVPVLEGWRKVLQAAGPLDALPADAVRGADRDGTRARR